LVKIKELHSPVISPDGKLVVYTVRSMEERPGKPGEWVYRSQLWLVSIDGKSGARQLTHDEAEASSPRWHPAGDRIAFVRRDKDKDQIWILPLSKGGGEPFPVTHVPTGATNPRWSPDGQFLLFSSALHPADVEKEMTALSTKPKSWKSERPGATFPATSIAQPGIPAGSASSLAKADGALRDRREWLAQNESAGNPRVLTRLNFLGEGDLQPAEEFNHVYVIGAAGDATPRPLTPGYFSADDAQWLKTASGFKIVFSRQPDSETHPDRVVEHELWLVNADGSAAERLLRDDAMSYSQPQPSPDGSSIAFLATDESKKSYDQVQVGTVAATGRDKRLLTGKLDRTAFDPRWSRDGKFLYFVASSNGGFPLYRVSARGGTIDRLTAPAEGVRDYDLAEQNAVVVVTKPSNPYELYRVNPAGKEARLLTVHNSEWLRTKTLSAPQRRELTQPDGTKIEYWLLRPAFFENGKYPLLIAIHGGPQAMWGPGEATTWHEFQYFAARGYGVVFCNPRGSGGYGYSFQHASFQDWGPGPASDVLAMVNDAAKETWVDPDRLVISGGSYGGYLTAWIISHDHRFKAAIAQRGVYDLRVFFGEGNAWQLIPYQFGGYPWDPEIRKMLEEQSPLTHVAEIRTPLLIKQGDADHRTGLAQSELLYKSLKALDRPVEYVRYPRATHELSRSGEPLQRIDRLVRFDEFFQRFVGKADAPEKPEKK
jgi:dipeptidyl aminopeptidase/acylaminoacyl peptidase